jgi:putative chitinase
MITLEELHEIMPHAKVARLEMFIGPLNEAMQEFGISDTVEREAAFLAQVAHESGETRYVHEIATGEAYEGRKDLGNIQPGDGVRFKGRGLIQITGRSNYHACGEALGLPLLDQPYLLETPIHACRSAAWYWQTHGLNELADKGDFLLITKRINGGTNGYADRMAYFARAQSALA